MTIRVSEIPDDGLVIEGAESIPTPFADRTWRLDDLSLTLERSGQEVLVRGGLKARVPQTCSRCLETFQIEVAPRVDARFLPAPVGRGEERELAADDLETDVYFGDSLDLAALVETETTLGLPMKPLCREGCRGLCTVCGVNRNTAACSCAAAAPDPRWTALQALADRLAR
jgi:uncharacterized protein